MLLSYRQKLEELAARIEAAEGQETNRKHSVSYAGRLRDYLRKLDDEPYTASRIRKDFRGAAAAAVTVGARHRDPGAAYHLAIAAAIKGDDDEAFQRAYTWVETGRCWQQERGSKPPEPLPKPQSVPPSPSPQKKASDELLKEFVYRADSEMVVFAPRSALDKHLAVLWALRNSKTWGELEMWMPQDVFLEILQEFDDGDESRPVPDAPFSPEQIGTYKEGSLPRGLEVDMDKWIPREILKKYAGPSGGINSPGFWWGIDMERADAMAEELRQRGYEVTRRDDIDFF